MQTRAQGSSGMVCERCKIPLGKIKDEFEPPGTFYHPMEPWCMDMMPLNERKPCPNAGKKFRITAKGSQ